MGPSYVATLYSVVDEQYEFATYGIGLSDWTVTPSQRKYCQSRTSKTDNAGGNKSGSPAEAVIPCGVLKSAMKG
jgi:hypothetical protein